MKREAKAVRKTSKPRENEGHSKKPKLRPIQELICKICRDDHTKGIIVR